MKSDIKSFYIILTIKIMLMNVLLNMRMFGLFSETSQEVTNNEMQEAYGEFVEQIRTISNGNDYSTTYRILAATRIEIVLLETIPLYGQGKNALKKLFIQNTGYYYRRHGTAESKNSVPQSISK